MQAYKAKTPSLLFCSAIVCIGSGVILGNWVFRSATFSRLVQRLVHLHPWTTTPVVLIAQIYSVICVGMSTLTSSNVQTVQADLRVSCTKRTATMTSSQHGALVQSKQARRESTITCHRVCLLRRGSICNTLRLDLAQTAL